jgi:hypothetical protein
MLMRIKTVKSSIKNKVRKHLNEDIKESKESISEDKKLKKIVRK